MDELLSHSGVAPVPSDALLLLSAKRAAKVCGISLRTWRTYDSGGRIPKPVRIGRRTLWRADELRAWVAASCPCRADWEAR
jgi:predicted DNA-binding transcriptional regulator AlpA